MHNRPDARTVLKASVDIFEGQKTGLTKFKMYSPTDGVVYHATNYVKT